MFTCWNKYFTNCCFALQPLSCWKSFQIRVKLEAGMPRSQNFCVSTGKWRLFLLPKNDITAMNVTFNECHTHTAVTATRCPSGTRAQSVRLMNTTGKSYWSLVGRVCLSVVLQKWMHCCTPALLLKEIGASWYPWPVEAPVVCKRQ